MQEYSDHQSMDNSSGGGRGSFHRRQGIAQFGGAVSSLGVVPLAGDMQFNNNNSQDEFNFDDGTTTKRRSISQQRRPSDNGVVQY